MNTNTAIFATQVGIAAGLATSLCWTFTSVMFTEAARRVGPTAVNLGRLLLAVGFLGLTHRFITGFWVPDATSKQIILLAASGLIGLTIGDQALFMAFMDVGPRLATLMMTTAPIVATFIGWVALGETLGWLSVVGMAMTVGGVGWVILEKPPTEIGKHPPHRFRGIVLALIASCCQAVGLLLSKAGLGHGWLESDQHMSPLDGTLIRMTFAMITMLPLYRMLRRREARLEAVEKVSRPAREDDGPGRRKMVGLMLVLGGAALGPFLGVWMSLVAADNAPVGIAQTLLSLPPVLLLPIAWVWYRERFGWTAILGALLAVGGVALLATDAG